MTFDNIVMIGAGRVATQLGQNLCSKQKNILQIYSRNSGSSEQLAARFHAEPIHNLTNLTTKADLYIIAVVDDAIAEIANKLKLYDKVVVHTSGSISMEVLKTASANYGVFYPLQTFAKDKIVGFKNIPLCIEASGKDVEMALSELAREFSDDVRLITSEQRILIHIAAVFANNFTNFMYLMGEEILKKTGVSFDILLPLINETVHKVEHSLPHLAQTGPAARGDLMVIEKHLKILASQPEKKEIYQHLSKFILSHFKNQDQHTPT